MTPERLSSLIAQFPTRRVAIIGDFFLDKYLEVDDTRAEISLETGKVAHQVVAVRCSPGAAGNVVNNLSALGAGTLHALGYLGDDGEAFDLVKQLRELRCSTDGLIRVPDRTTPTYLKPRTTDIPGIEGEHERYDTKNRSATPAKIERQIIDSLDALLPELDAVIVIDQVEEDNCGVVTDTVRTTLAERARTYADVIFFADSRFRILQFRNMVIKPNQFELFGIENPSRNDEVAHADITDAVRKLRKKVNGPICVTRGARGIFISDPDPVEVCGVQVAGQIDPTGAGDSVTAGMVVALASGANLYEAAVVGNLVASVTIQQLGTCGSCRADELMPRLEMWLSQGKSEK